MSKSKQLGFEILEIKGVKYFGGAYLKNSNPKEKRPISTKRSMHLVMRSSHAKGANSFLRRDRKIREVIAAQAKRFGVKVYRQANGGNHLHLIVLPESRAAFQGFMRAITGVIARLTLKAERGSAKGIQFWDKRPFTRVVEWGRDYNRACRYLLQNVLEAYGFIPYQPRKIRHKLKESTG
jgi:REP element-mobilizing transposase RayT